MDNEERSQFFLDIKNASKIFGYIFILDENFTIFSPQNFIKISQNIPKFIHDPRSGHSEFFSFFNFFFVIILKVSFN